MLGNLVLQRLGIDGFVNVPKAGVANTAAEEQQCQQKSHECLQSKESAGGTIPGEHDRLPVGLHWLRISR